MRRMSYRSRALPTEITCRTPDNKLISMHCDGRAESLFFWDQSPPPEPDISCEDLPTNRADCRHNRRSLEMERMNVMISAQVISARRNSAIALSAAIAFTAIGCKASKPKEAPWTPAPQVSWEHVATQQSPVAQSGYKLLTPGQTIGLFPANLGVTRVAIDLKTDGQLVPQLTANPRNEFLQWNYAFDDLMAISEVFPIIQRDLGGGEATPDQILSSFDALNAKLALIYGVNQLAENESEMFGTLYDVRNSKPVASLRAHVVSLEIPKNAEDKDDPYHMWATDSRAIVRDKFADTLHGCMRELILQDEPPALEDKSGWTPAGPVRPAVWPPHNKKYRRGPR